MSDLDHKPPAEELPALDVTPIDRTNLSYFAALIPPEFHAGVKDGTLLALGAISEDTACAALVAEIAEACMELRSIFVAPSYRRQYIASTLIGELLDLIAENGDLGIQSLSAEYADDGSGVKEFLDYIGFEQEMLDEKTYSIPVSALSDCKFMKRTPSPGIKVMSLDTLSAFHLREISQAMESREANYFGKPIGPDTVLTRLSFADFRDNRPVGCVCLSKGNGEDELVMTVFFISESKLPVPMTLLRAAAESVMEHCPGVSVIKIPVLTGSAEQLLQALTGGVAKVSETMYSAVLEV